MGLQKLEIQGLRGFANLQELPFAIPNNERGSGLTILVGPNNGGKSTIVEGLRTLTTREAQSFTEGRRNKRAGDRVLIRATDTDGNIGGVRTVESGGSETERLLPGVDGKLFVLPSRRYFDPFFNRFSVTRESYMMDFATPANRGAALQMFGARLFGVQQNRAEFDALLGKVVRPIPRWVIEQSDTGSYYLKVETSGQHHSSEGMGEGFVSLLIIIDALYDSEEGSMVVIDEPELSLHPYLQRRLSALLSEYAATRQIVVATHSPYFADFHALLNGARISRLHLEGGSSVVSTLSESTVRSLAGFLRDRNNPHVLGLDAREAFFLEDRVILVEGQEDVVLYQRVADAVGVDIRGDFFGWGVGGAEKMRAIAALLSELGFDKVVGLLDGNRGKLREELQSDFPQYRFHTIPANDIRTKPEVPVRPAVEGLLDVYGAVRPEYEEPMRALLTQINQEL